MNNAELRNDAELRACWHDLVELRIPETAHCRPDGPVRFDLCFARILLDKVCGRAWRETVRRPGDALALGGAVLAGMADLRAFDDCSLARRRKARARP